MKTIISALLVASATAAAVPAFAGSQGADQRAAQLGLPTDTYSMAQMVRMSQALDENDTATVKHILANPALGTVTQNETAVNVRAQVLSLTR